MEERDVRSRNRNNLYDLFSSILELSQGFFVTFMYLYINMNNNYLIGMT